MRKCLENPNFLLNAGTGRSGVVSTVVGCLLPSARSALVNDSQQWFLCLYPGTAHHVFPNQEDAVLGEQTQY